jgi:lysyl-tRNA synthetase, class II
MVRAGNVLSGRTIGLVVGTTRAAGLLAVLAVAFPTGRRLLRPSLARWLGLPFQAHIAALVTTAIAGVGLLCLATGLRRRKRRAWQLALAAATLIAALQLVFRHSPLLTLLVVGLAVLLIVHQHEFTALPDPAAGRWRAAWVFLQFTAAGVAINLVVLLVSSRRLAGDPTFTQRLEHAALSLVGVSGPVGFRSAILDDLTATIGMVFGLTAVLLAGYLLLRSAEPHPSTTEADRGRLRALLDTHGADDSLAYFALRTDKSAVFSASGKAAVTYRVLAGVALSSGDPLGDPEAWPGAIEAYLRTCARYGWVPAVLGCSERGARTWCRHGLRALELGDEAIVDAATFTLDGRTMRGVRQMATRAARAGHHVRVRRAGALDDAERARLAELAEQWRGSEPERGFSMALGRVAHAADPDCVVVTAECEGEVRGLLQFVPWGTEGLSLDVMRRARDACGGAGLNELMIVELLAACPGLGIRRVSLNFAVFRAALERGERIGAGPIARLWARALRLGSRWWQIDSLYRFNDKFHPGWVPRFIAFPAARELPRITLAALEAEGFGGRPPVLLRALHRTVPGGRHDAEVPAATV